MEEEEGTEIYEKRIRVERAREGEGTREDEAGEEEGGGGGRWRRLVEEADWKREEITTARVYIDDHAPLSY
jgi:hypothetical protein